MPDGPLIVQSDKTLLLEVDHAAAAEARAAIAPFAELERAPEHIHTYRVTPLALWNARAAGHDAEQVVDALVRFSRYAVPQPLLVDIVDTMGRYGRLQLAQSPVHGLVLVALDRAVLEEVLRQKRIAPLLGARIDGDTVVVHPSERGHLKQALLKIGWPAEDLAGYVDGEAHPIDLREDGWSLRDYQRHAVDGFFHGGSGVVVLPCGAGKTLVGAAAMAKAKATTLILVTNTVAGRQWKRELIARTTLTEEEIGEYSGERKEIRPVTIATYQVMTRKSKGEYRHLDLFDSRDGGLIVYDEYRRGEQRVLVVSKVANFSIDLPEASVAVQVSGTFGSRQEEAQRLGRLLRPKVDGRQAWFYSVVSRDTVDTEYAAHRQRFLAEQGYAYRIVDADDLLGPAIPDVE